MNLNKKQTFYTVFSKKTERDNLEASQLKTKERTKNNNKCRFHRDFYNFHAVTLAKNNAQKIWRQSLSFLILLTTNKEIFV